MEHGTDILLFEKKQRHTSTWNDLEILLGPVFTSKRTEHVWTLRAIECSAAWTIRSVWCALVLTSHWFVDPGMQEHLFCHLVKNFLEYRTMSILVSQHVTKKFNYLPSLRMSSARLPLLF